MSSDGKLSLGAAFWRLWALALIAKTALAIGLPFSNDEAYYWVWGHHPAWSYFDHPAFVGWLFSLGRIFENFGNAARLPGVWLGHLMLLFWAHMLRPYLAPRDLAFWLLFVLFSPFLGIGSLIITPDVPLLFFWTLSMWLLLRAIERPRLATYIALGASLGLGFCSKYMIVLFVPTALVWLGFSGSWRKVLWPAIPLTIGAGLLCCGPVLYWNATHEWASFQFQIHHGLSSEKWQAGWPLEYLGGQIGIAFPLVIWAVLRRDRGSHEKHAALSSFLRAFTWLPLAFFLYSSFKAHVEANWPIMAHPALLSLAVVRNPRWRGLKVTLGLWMAAHVILLSEVAHHWIPVDESRLKTSEFSRFDLFLPLARAHPAFFLGSYQAASAISYKLRREGRQIYKLRGMNREDFYDFVPESTPKDDSFWVGCETDQGLPEWALQAGYREIASTPLSKDFRLIEVKKLAQDSRR